MKRNTWIGLGIGVALSPRLRGILHPYLIASQPSSPLVTELDAHRRSGELGEKLKAES